MFVVCNCTTIKTRHPILLAGIFLLNIWSNKIVFVIQHGSLQAKFRNKLNLSGQFIPLTFLALLTLPYLTSENTNSWKILIYFFMLNINSKNFLKIKLYLLLNSEFVICKIIQDLEKTNSQSQNRCINLFCGNVKKFSSVLSEKKMF